jgi:hypothetical protein
LGKEFLVQNYSKLTSDPHIVCRHQVCVTHGCSRVDVSEPFLSNGHRGVWRIEQCGVSVTERVCAIYFVFVAELFVLVNSVK